MINYQLIQAMQKKGLTFPECVVELRSLEIERYYVDLVRMEKIYYAKNGDSYIERMPVADMPLPANYFNEAQIIQTLHDHQQGIIDYYDFLRNIVRHGTTDYVIYLDGKKMVYNGRNGDNYTKEFSF